MKSFAVLALLAASSVSAAKHGLRHGHAGIHDRNAPAGYNKPTGTSKACGCTTYTTTWYGDATLIQDKPKPTTSSCTSTSTSSSSSTSTSTWVAPTTTSTWEAPTTTSTWEAPSSTSTWEAPASTPEVQAAAAPSAPAPKNDNNNKAVSAPASNGNQWAMTYTPYSDSGSCKSASEVASDIASIKSMGFNTVRLYATDCSGVQNVGAAALSVGVKLILGIYIDGSGIGVNTDAQVSAIISWGHWDIVEMVVAGNEAIFNGFVDAGSLASFILDVKAKFGAAGYSGPVTTTEPLGTIQANGPTLCGAVDVIAANIHAFFNSAISAGNAGTFVSSQLSILADVCGGSKKAYNLETGWPSGGSANGEAVPSPENQVSAIKSIIESAGPNSVIFSFANDVWKHPGQLGVEQHWGCGNLFEGADNIMAHIGGAVEGAVGGVLNGVGNILGSIF